MGLFDKIFGKAPVIPKDDGFFQSLTAYRPAFTSWNGRLYESELVRSAIGARANHISKLEVDIAGTAKPLLRTILRHAPNEWQTWGQFLYRTSTILDMQNNCFIVPVMHGNDVVGIYPVLPSECTVVDVDGEPFLRYRFNNGKTAAIELSACGIMTKFQYEDDFFGSTNNALNDTMELMHLQTQGIKEAVKNSNTFRFMAKLTNFTKSEDLAKERKRFNAENLRDGSGGLLLFPNTYSDIRQIEGKSYVVDPEQLNLIRTNVFNYFGVNEDILQSKAFGDSLDGFFDGAIEPFSIQLSDVLSRMLFSANERSRGNKVMVIANRLQYMSTSNKVSMAREMGDRGVMLIDEIRALFNLEPLPDGAGQHAPIRGEYYMVDQGKDGDGNAQNGNTGIPGDAPDGGTAQV